MIPSKAPHDSGGCPMDFPLVSCLGDFPIWEASIAQETMGKSPRSPIILRLISALKGCILNAQWKLSKNVMLTTCGFPIIAFLGFLG